MLRLQSARKTLATYAHAARAHEVVVGCHGGLSRMQWEAHARAGSPQ